MAPFRAGFHFSRKTASRVGDLHQVEFQSLYEPGGALRGPRNLKNGTWVDFKSLYEPGDALRGQKNLKNGTWADKKKMSDFLIRKLICY